MRHNKMLDVDGIYIRIRHALLLLCGYSLRKEAGFLAYQKGIASYQWGILLFYPTALIHLVYNWKKVYRDFKAKEKI